MLNTTSRFLNHKLVARSQFISASDKLTLRVCLAWAWVPRNAGFGNGLNIQIFNNYLSVVQTNETVEPELQISN